MTRCALVLALVSILFAPSAEAGWTVGAEGGEHRGYAFLTYSRPLSAWGGGGLDLWGTASYQYYRVVQATGSTDVTAPGIGAGVTYHRRVSERFWFAAGPGYEYRWIRRRLPTGGELDEDQGGVVFQGAAEYRIAERTRLAGTAGLYGATDWTWFRGSLRQEITPTLRAGPEIGFQGNAEVRVREIGGVVEIPYGRNWLFLRAGQATDEYQGGLEETRPYFSVGVTRSF
ncbi:MAG TPA: hypothetical protein VM557_03845 [Thermoanaerobaculia bacterium]|nr:hypothetical protein [Thermoanaerobaculia bacterium]